MPGASNTVVNVAPDLVSLSVYTGTTLYGGTLISTFTYIAPAVSALTHRYLDLRASGNGMWLLPAGKAPNFLSNWIQVEANSSRTKHCSYQLFNDADFSTQLVSGIYYPRILPATIIGDSRIVTGKQIGRAHV